MSFPYKSDPAILLKKWQHVIDQTADIFTWTSGHELAWLCEMASHSQSICEIGSYHGNSAKVMALANPECKILCIDNCENADVEDMFAWNLAAQILSGQVQFLKGSSYALYDAELKSRSHLKFDACFIDGGHLFDDVQTDITHLRDRMDGGAIMAGHDYRVADHNDGVNRAVHAAFGRPDGVFESIWWVKLP